MHTHDVSRIPENAITLFIKGLEAKGYSKQEIAAKLESIGLFVQWAYDKDHLEYKRYQHLKDEIAKYSSKYTSPAALHRPEDRSEAISSDWASPIQGRSPPSRAQSEFSSELGKDYRLKNWLNSFYSALPFVHSNSKTTTSPADRPVLGPVEAWPRQKAQEESITEAATEKATVNFRSPAFLIATSMTLLLLSILTLGIYDRFFKTAQSSFAYPSAPTSPSTRVLSFQGRLTDSLGNPITAATNMRFRLYTASSGGSTLYDSGTCSISPDTDGVHNVLVGSDCGAGIGSSVFTENAEVWMGVTVGSDSEMIPRQQIANVPYALNAETLQGLPVGTGVSNIPYINADGDLLMAAAGPQIGSTFASQTFLVTSANAITIQSAGSGDVTLTATQSGTIKFATGGSQHGIITNGGLIGFGTSGPDAKLDVLSTAGEQLRLTYSDGSQYTSFNTSSAGDLTIAPSGADLNLTGSLTTTGDVAVNGDDITSDGTSLKVEVAGTGTTGILQVGVGGAGSTTPDYFGLGVKSDTGDPAGGFEGAMYYNTSDNKFRCYQGSAWTDCISSSTASPWTDSGTTTYLTDTTDEVVIGGSSPLSSAKFSIDGDDDTIQTLIRGHSTQNENILEVETSGADNLLTLNNSGNLAIEGTLSDISGNLAINDSTDITGGLTISGATQLGDASGDTVLSNAAAWTFANDTDMTLSGGVNGLSFDGTTFSVDATNNRIGIGTAAPSSPLTVSGGTGGTSTPILSVTQTDNSGQPPIASFIGTGGGTITMEWAGNITLGNSNNMRSYGYNQAFFGFDGAGSSIVNGQSNVIFKTYSGSNIERMRIANAGNVGIGNASPVGFLDVSGKMTGKALTILNETGNQALLTASSSGTTRYTLANNGNITYSPSAFGSPITLYDTDTTLPNANTGIVDAINDAYTAAIGGGGGLWTDSGTTTYLTTTTDDIVLGGSSPLSSGKFSIDGDADQIQLIVQGNGTQTSSLAVFEQSDGTDVLTISNAGNLALAGGTLSDSSDGVDIADDLEISGGTTLGDASGDTVTANAAAWTFANDTTVALSGGVNGLNFDSNTLSIDASGDKIGIGTAAPVSKFHVTGAVTGKALAIFNETGDQDILVGSASGNTRFRVANDGTVYGGYLLDISNTAYGIDPAGTSNFGGYSMKVTGGALLAADSGNVGIGDQTPDTKLNIQATTEQLRLDYDDSNYASFTVGSGGDITIAPTGNDTNVTGNLAISGGTTLGDASGDTVTANAAAWTFANDTTVALSGGVNGINFDSNTLSIDATNNRVGIGTAAPAVALEVSGNTRVSTGILQLWHAGTNPKIDMSNGGGATLGTIEWNTAFKIGNVWNGGATSNIAFYANAAEKMTLTGTGLLGVGTTGPDARIDSLYTSGEQLRLTYTDGSAYTGFTVGSGGDITLDTTGGDVIFANADVLNIGGNGDDVAFSAIGDDTASASNVASDNDLYIEDDLEVDGTIFGSLEGTVDLNFTDGSVLFANSSGAIAQDNTNFFFNDTTNKLGLGDTTPDAFLDATGTTEQLRLSYETGDTNYASFTLGSGGDLTVAPTGGDIAFTGNGDFSGGLNAGSSNHFNVDSSGNIGIGTTASGTYGIRMSKTVNPGTTPGYYAESLGINHSGTVGSTQNMYGQRIQVTEGTTYTGGNGSNHYLFQSEFINNSSTWAGYSALGNWSSMGANANANSNYMTGFRADLYNSGSNTGTGHDYSGFASNTANYTSSTIATWRGFTGNITNSSTGVYTNAYQFIANSPTNTSGTITTIYGMHIADQSVGTNTTAYGLYIANQSGASGNAIGLYIADADDYSIQLASTDGDAASGITFGTDTNLYRNSANQLHTDDSLDVDGSLTIDGNTGLGNAATDVVTVTGKEIINFDTSATDQNGLYVNSSQSTATAGTLRGLNVGANFWATSGTQTGVNGLDLTVQATGNGGTVTTMKGISAWGTVSTGATVGTFKLSDVANPSNSGTITNLSGYSVDNLTSGTNNTLILAGTTSIPTGNWGIYNSSSYSNYLSGTTGIGTTGADAKLDVLSTTEQLRLTYTDGSVYSAFTTNSSGDLTIDPTGGDLIVDGNVLPNTDDTYDLGSDTKRWRDAYLGGETIHIGTSTSDEATIGYTTSSNTLAFTNNYGDTNFTSSSDGYNFTLGGGAGDDFIVDTSTFTVESDNDRVGIGTTTPDAAWLDIAAATSAKAQINLTTSAGTDVSTPSSGDLWWNGTNLYFYNGSINKDLLAAGGSGPWTDGGSYVYTTSGEVLNLGGVTGVAYHAISDSGTTSHSLASDDDLFVEGDTEVDGTLYADGETVLTTVSGAGLSDCDSSTSILLWDSSTKQFSCGKDNDLTTLGPWTKTNLAASQTDLQLDRPLSTTLPQSSSEMYMPYAGNIVGISIGGNAARSAGSATFTVFKNDSTTGFTCVIDGTNTQYNKCTQSTGSDTFSAGDYLDVRVTTDGSWSPTTTEFSAEIWIEMDTGADVAELYNVKDGTIRSADIVSIDPTLTDGVMKSTGKYDTNIIGVIATKPGVLLGMHDVPDIGASRAVALTGRVPVKVTSENGPIHAGDSIAASSLPGVGMKSTQAARVVGRALSDWTDADPHKVGTVMMFVEPGYDSGYILTQVQELIIDAQNTLVAETLAVKKIIAETVQATSARFETLIAQTLTADQATLTDAQIANLNATALKAQTIEAEKITTAELKTNTLKADTLEAKDASISGTLVAGNIDAKNVRELRDRLEKLAADQSNSALSSEELDSQIEDIQGYIAELSEEETPEDIADTETYQLLDQQVSLDAGSTESVLGGTIETAHIETLTVTGQASMTTLAVADAFSAGEVFIKDNTILSLNNELKLSALEKVTIMNGGVTITADGTITSKGEVIAEKGIRTNSIKPLESGDDVAVVLEDASFGIDSTDGTRVASIDSSGSASFSDLALDTYNEATSSAVVIGARDNYRQTGLYVPAIKTNAAASGNGILPAGESHILVFNSKIGPKSVINLTPTSTTMNKSMYVDKVETCTGAEAENELCQPYFRVSLDQDIPVDATFNWLIIH